ncbi:NUDIX hydrolase [Actinomyces faecalis]|uniref:NUDIX hydrolase n=1 Tax=Actinomyces faecalis TaxID=2722820 RepID=UPI0015550123|nr:NUDIX domain-containing protein [Actinomyces faecalis]
MAVRSFSLVPAAYVYLLRADATGRPQVLLQLRRGTGYMDGYWACGVAGHVEDGESVLTTAVREAAEEVGVVVDLAELRPLTATHRSNDVGGAPLEQRVDFFFTLRHWSGQPQVRESEKNAGLSWWPLDALPEKVPPHERAVLSLLAAELDGGPQVPAVTVFGFVGEEIDRYVTARDHGPAQG